VRLTTRTGEPAAGVRVIVGGRDGVASDPARPASRNWWLRSARGDADGVARFEALPPGAVAVRVEEPGFTSAGPVEAVLRDGETTRVAVDESRSRDVVVRIVDGKGNPLPGAVVSPNECRWDWEPVDGGGVQHRDLVTDAARAVLLPRVPAGPMRIRARRGDAHGEAVVGDGERTATLVL
jgi:hypothetical protein